MVVSVVLEEWEAASSAARLAFSAAEEASDASHWARETVSAEILDVSAAWREALREVVRDWASSVGAARSCAAESTRAAGTAGVCLVFVSCSILCS